jgi:hypothetical protein
MAAVNQTEFILIITQAEYFVISAADTLIVLTY